MATVQTTGIVLLVYLPSFIAAGHALLHKRDSRSSLLWMITSLTLPFLGPIFYWCLGINRISRRARIWKQSGRRMHGAELRPEETGEAVELPEFAKHLADLQVMGDRIVYTPLRAGNQLFPLVNGEAAYPAMLAAIKSAEQNINICSYIFDGNGIGAEFVRELAAAAERGVEVRVILDALGEKYSPVSPAKALADTKVRLKRYLPLKHGAYINLRNHRKLMVIDGREAFTGGMNIRDNHMPSRFAGSNSIYDLHFRVKGPVVGDLQRTFQEDWFFVAGEKLEKTVFFPPLISQGSSFTRCISDGPDREFRKLNQIILGALSCAKRSVCIMTPYFVPDRTLTAALITTALRGVPVVIVLPEKNNLPFVQWASRAILDELLANDIHIFFQPPPFVHTKLFLIDEVWSLVGSTNLDSRSLRLNFELNLSIFCEEFAEEMQAHFTAARAQSRQVTRKELRDLSLPVRLTDNFARLFSPYL